MGGYFSRRSDVKIVLSTDPVKNEPLTAPSVAKEEIREGCTGTVETPVFQKDAIVPVVQEEIREGCTGTVETPVFQKDAVAPVVPELTESAPNSPEKRHKKKHRKN